MKLTNWLIAIGMTFISMSFVACNKDLEHKKEEKVKAAAFQQKTHQHIASTPYEMDKQEQLDEILDKINKSGYDSLSTDEKTFLFKISQED